MELFKEPMKVQEHLEERELLELESLIEVADLIILLEEISFFLMLLEYKDGQFLDIK